MSADSKSQSSSQPPLSQLWPGFGSTTSDLSNPLEHHQTNQSSSSVLCSGLEKQQLQLQPNNNNNNNYVNFNQFIRQHNLASTHQNKSPMGTFIEDSFASKESRNTDYEDAFNLIHGIAGLKDNKHTNINSNVIAAVNEGNNVNRQQPEQQHYNVSA